MFTLGIDYGTNSVRALFVRAEDGAELGAGTCNYPSGEQGVLLDPRQPHLARQHPGDYLLALEKCVAEALSQAQRNPGFDSQKVAAVAVDTTGSSPIPVDATNQALGMLEPWKTNLDAQCWLWKDHTSWQEASQITELAAQQRPQYLAKCGNTYSSEWFWSKIWHCHSVAPDVFQAAHSWVELSDWIPAVLCGVRNPIKIQRGVCAAGHKAMFSEEWGGLPDSEFLSLLHPDLAALLPRLYSDAFDASYPAGSLCPEWAERLGLPQGIPVGVGLMDVHYGAIGCGVQEGTLVKVIGTSTCDCGVLRADRTLPDIPGICGVVHGSILPGYFGIEAGQSAVGDIFKWWIEGVCEGDESLYAKLESEASALSPGQSGLLALDWNNGNRTILVDPMLTGLMVGTTLRTTRAEVYRALVEATAFGARAIIERLAEYQVPVERIVCAGGLAEKSPMLMQIYSDVTGRTMQVSGSPQACALGAAVGASVLAGLHPDWPQAQKAMTSTKDLEYKPRPEAQAVYDQLYVLYRELHDAFGGLQKRADLGKIMKDLLKIQEIALKA
ncbi:MAG: ribulokinase [Verrucomicrobiales bacterium]